MEQGKEISIIKDLFRQIPSMLESKQSALVLHDLFLQVDRATGELQVYGDGDSLLASKVIFSWIEEGATEPDERVIGQLRGIVQDLQQEEYFEQSCFDQPFSVQLVHDDFSLIEELLFIDGAIVRIDDPLLKGYSEELDKFISELLAD